MNDKEKKFDNEEIKEETQEENKPTKRPHLKRSNCILTINTNKRIDIKDPSLPKIINNLEAIFSRVFTGENVLNSIIFRDRAPAKKLIIFGLNH